MKFNSSFSFPDTTSYTWTRVGASSSDNTVFPSGGVRGDDRAALQENGGGEDRFAVRAGRFIYGCGAFFALKIQSAKSAKQMEDFAKEVANLEKLRGHSNIVQIRDHTIRPRSHHVVILMELAACDLDAFFKNSEYSFDVSSKLAIWRSLVNAVDAAHTEDIIHRDLKPKNFLLVPIAPPFADRILATTAVPSDKFEFRIVNRAKTSDSEKVGDVELSLKDSATGTVQVLQLIIKVSDFGLAQPLDLDAHANGRSHLSVRGHAGTIKYMAPEAFQASEDAVQRITKRVDIWALGVILFQMLHGGRTPFDRYCSPGNNINAAVAIASKDIHAKVMKFERQSVWAAEKKSLRCDPRTLRSSDSEDEDTAANVCQSLTAVSLLSTEFLFRMCENCLSFEASDRVLAGDLKIWVGHLLDSNWWEETMSSLSDAAVEALFSGVSMKDDDVETASQLDNLNLVQQGGDTIEQIFFPELRRAASPPRHATVNIDIVDLPATEEAVEGGKEGGDGTQLQAVVLPAKGEALEERAQAEADEGSQLQVVPVLPARGEAEEVEEREQSDDVTELQARVLPAGGEEVEECAQSDDGAQTQLQAVPDPVLPVRGEEVEEREQSDYGTQLQAVVLPARGGAVEEYEGGDSGTPQEAVVRPVRREAVEECEEGDDEVQSLVAQKQELLPRCINGEDCGCQGADCPCEFLRIRPKRRMSFSSAQSGSCGLSIFGIIGIIACFVLAVGLFFVVLKLIPEPRQDQGPPALIPGDSTAPMFPGPATISPSSPAPAVFLAPTIIPSSPPVPAPTPRGPTIPPSLAPTPPAPAVPVPAPASPGSSPGSSPRFIPAVTTPGSSPGPAKSKSSASYFELPSRGSSAGVQNTSTTTTPTEVFTERTTTTPTEAVSSENSNRTSHQRVIIGLKNLSDAIRRAFDEQMRNESSILQDVPRAWWRKADRPNTVNIQLSVVVSFLSPPLPRWLSVKQTTTPAFVLLLSKIDCRLHFDRLMDGYDRLEVVTGSRADSEPPKKKKIQSLVPPPKKKEPGASEGLEFATDNDRTLSVLDLGEELFSVGGEELFFGLRDQFVFLSKLFLTPVREAYFDDKAQTVVIIPFLANWNHHDLPVTKGAPTTSTTNMKLFLVLEGLPPLSMDS